VLLLHLEHTVQVPYTVHFNLFMFNVLLGEKIRVFDDAVLLFMQRFVLQYSVDFIYYESRTTAISLPV
jgi:hypothetical protein